MADIRCRTFSNSVWIPLRSSHEIESIGRQGYAGFKEEFFGCGTLAVPYEKKTPADKLGWDDIGITRPHGFDFEGEKYIPSDVYRDYRGEFTGLHLVLEQSAGALDITEWHLHQDFVMALGLQREGDMWLRPSEGYVEVVRLKRKENGKPILIEARSEHLRDFLCARKMSLRMSSYWSRHAVAENKCGVTWTENPYCQSNAADRWEGHITEIHEGGHRFGSKVAVLHISRTDVDPADDVPNPGFPTDGNVISKSSSRGFEGRKLYRIHGELWRNEWIDPADKSPRIKGDKLPPTVFFITDEKGKRENRETLQSGLRWLWFSPSIVMALLERRRSSLEWYTAETGSVGCLSGDDVHFGINRLGLINVLGKDIAYLPDWQQQVWAGYNVSPEGGVSEELQDSQVRAEPADTQAPEAFLKSGLQCVNELSKEKLGFLIFKEHEFIPELLKKCHRFRVMDKAGLLALAKDIARLTADSIDGAAIKTIVSPPKDEKWGSLKSLENLLAQKIGPETARSIMGALFGAYELRLDDAHLPSKEFDEATKLLQIDAKLPWVHQGRQLLEACVTSIHKIINVLGSWK